MIYSSKNDIIDFGGFKMDKKVFSILFAGILSVSSFACPTKEYINNVLREFRVPNFKVVKIAPSKDLKGFCEVVFKTSPLNASYFFISNDGNYIVQGQVINLKKKSLVAPDLSKYQRLSKNMLDDLEKHVDFVFNKKALNKDKKNYVYFITDPQCPFCHLAEPYLKKWALRNNVAIKVILYPVQTPSGSLHPGSVRKSAELLCDNNASYSMLEFMYDAKVPKHPCKSGLDKIHKNIEFLQKLGVDGTPTFIGPAGIVRVGIEQNEKAMYNEFDSLLK